MGTLLARRQVRLLAVAVALTTGASALTVAAHAASLPDLAARGGWVAQTGPTTADVGFKVLRRSGSVRRTTYVAGVNLPSAPGGWLELGRGSVRGLDLGVKRPVELDGLDLSGLPAGTHTITGCVDADFAVRESNEDNNCRSIGTVTIDDGNPAPDGPVQPVVVGNHLTDSRTGATWVPRGVNWPDLEYSCVNGADSWIPDHPAAETSAMATWNIDVVRIPLNEDCWLGTDGADGGDWNGSAATYQAAVATRVQHAHDAGLTVILDLHWTGPSGVLADGQRPMTDAQSVTFWSQVAAAYKDDPAVMFELFNEPYLERFFGATAAWDCWENGGCQVDNANQGQPESGTKYTVVGMAQLLAAVRAAGAHQPVLLGGLNYSNDLTQWLAHRPAGDDQLVAAFHNYNGQGCGPACWTSTIASVAAQVPVVMTEFGYSYDATSWMSNVMAFGDTNGIGYLPWAWWDLPASPGTDLRDYALLQPGSYLPRSPVGTTYHDHLVALP
jgi:hypothetical protein